MWLKGNVFMCTAPHVFPFIFTAVQRLTSALLELVHKYLKNSAAIDAILGLTDLIGRSTAIFMYYLKLSVTDRLLLMIETLRLSQGRLL